MIDKSPLKKYYDRYSMLKENHKLTNDPERLLDLMENDLSGLNNFIMAALGLSTLILRLGAVIQLSRKLQDGNSENDAEFMKNVIANLSESLPTDDSWKKLWIASCEKNSSWANNDILLGKFVTTRNYFAHDCLSKLVPDKVNELSDYIKTFSQMEELIILFKDSTIIEKDNQYYFVQNNPPLILYPFLQKGESDNLPYLFQGLYHNKNYDSKKEARLISTIYGNEIEQDPKNHIEPVFEPLKQSLKGGNRNVFNHEERISKYIEDCFVGRATEIKLILDWCVKQDEKNILPIYAPAGMGKGALIAKVVKELKNKNEKILYHFCSSGETNSLHAILYHFILQGKNLWKDKKTDRLPSKYKDLINFFQNLLNDYDKVDQMKLEESINKMRDSNNFDALLGIYESNNMLDEFESLCKEILQKDPTDIQVLEKLKKGPNIKKNKNLVIIIDGLDEAAVANSSLHISDWFYTHDENDENKKTPWRSPSNIRWIFTYRKTEGQKGYQFPFEKEGAKIEELQPLLGLSESAVDAALSKFIVSEDFKKEVLKKGTII
jgi:hypothetical protein